MNAKIFIFILSCLSLSLVGSDQAASDVESVSDLENDPILSEQNQKRMIQLDVETVNLVCYRKLIQEIQDDSVKNMLNELGLSIHDWIETTRDKVKQNPPADIPFNGGLKSRTSMDLIFLRNNCNGFGCKVVETLKLQNNRQGR